MHPRAGTGQGGRPDRDPKWQEPGVDGYLDDRYPFHSPQQRDGRGPQERPYRPLLPLNLDPPNQHRCAQYLDAILTDSERQYRADPEWGPMNGLPPVHEERQILTESRARLVNYALAAIYDEQGRNLGGYNHELAPIGRFRETFPDWRSHEWNGPPPPPQPRGRRRKTL